MDSPQYVQPILFLIFNRPEKTKQVFEAIRAQKPRQIFIAADGPRSNVESDKASCDQTRSIIDEIDWDCSLQTLFRSENLGCKLAVSSAIDWFSTMSKWELSLRTTAFQMTRFSHSWTNCSKNTAIALKS